MAGWGLLSMGGSLLVFAAEVPQANPLWQMAPFIVIAVTFVFLVWLPNSRDQKRRQEALNALKKNDRVFTSSGIIGTVANISADGREVTLKVDDNVKIRVFRKAIEGFYVEPQAPENSSPTS